MPSEQQTLDAAPLDNYNSKPMGEYYSNEFSHHGSAAVIAPSEHHTSKEPEAPLYIEEKNQMIDDDQHSTSQKKTTDQQISSLPHSTMQTHEVAEASPAVAITTQKLDSLQLQNEHVNYPVKNKRSQKQLDKSQTYY